MASSIGTVGGGSSFRGSTVVMETPLFEVPPVPTPTPIFDNHSRYKLISAIVRFTSSAVTHSFTEHFWSTDLDYKNCKPYVAFRITGEGPCMDHVINCSDM